MPLPDRDFDVTEVSVPWALCREAGHEVVFCTEHGGAAPQADPLLLGGVLLAQLRAEKEACRLYRELEQDQGFANPLPWDRDLAGFDGLILAGGHAPGMKQYLGSERLQQRVSEFFLTGKPVGAICHGVIVLARSLDPANGRSVLYNRCTTSLCKYQEMIAYLLTFWKLGRYYRTYPAYVEDEVRAALAHPGQFRRGPVALRRDSRDNRRPAFVVSDGNYVSARWPGDAYTFSKVFLQLLANWNATRA
jgi:putative intracellular protease/amidase